MDNSRITSICRACLSEIGEFKSVFVSDDNSGYTIHLSEMIMACTSVQITFGDGLPEQICVACAEQTANMYLFKLKCEESDKILRERLEWSPLQDIYNMREEKYSEFLEMNDYNGTDLNVTIKSEIVIDESHEDDLISGKTLSTFGCNETEIISNDSEKPILRNNEVSKKVFKCEFCYKTFCNQSGLNRHIRDIHKTHSAIKKFECHTSNKRFTRKDLLLRHKIVHSKKMEVGNFSVSDDFKDDTIIIKTEPELYPCPECSVLFKRKEEMEMHVKQHNNESSNISCHVCTKKFSKQSLLNRHLRIHCKPHICSTCNKGFFKPEQLTNHMKVHSGVKRYICDICSKGFNHNTNFKNHMRIHSGDKPFLCSICHKGFNQSSSLRRHMIQHSGIKAHQCNTCGKGFATSCKLAAHNRIHSGERPYECDVCKKKFTLSGILKRHKRTHTGEKPYVCKICAKAFCQSNNLTAHLKRHAGEML